MPELGDLAGDMTNRGPLPRYLAGTLRIIGHHSRHVLVDIFSGRLIVLVLICAALLAGLLAAPVLGDTLFDSFIARAAKVAPAAFLLGLGVLLIGIATAIPILDVIGAGLTGAVLLGTIMVNY